MSRSGFLPATVLAHSDISQTKTSGDIKRMATKEEVQWLKVLIVLMLMLVLFVVALSSVFYAVKSIDEGPAARPSEWRR